MNCKHCICRLLVNCKYYSGRLLMNCKDYKSRLLMNLKIISYIKRGRRITFPHNISGVGVGKKRLTKKKLPLAIGLN